ncbi:hypothetical protein [Streptomyces sp. Qhu_M48]|uniref:hypothetical protein n=1 Tax=Streptomyces sp. Qhu_M48 TaxID=3435889 RepID=UPI003F50A19C
MVDTAGRQAFGRERLTREVADVLYVDASEVEPNESSSSRAVAPPGTVARRKLRTIADATRARRRPRSLGGAGGRARLDEGPAPEAVGRLRLEFFDLTEGRRTVGPLVIEAEAE